MPIEKIKIASTYHDLIANNLKYATCSTAAGTAAKTASTNGTLSLTTGARITVRFTNANSAASPTLNIDSTGAKAIYYQGSTITSSQYWQAGAVLDFVYNGSQWELVGANTIYTEATESKAGLLSATDKKNINTMYTSYANQEAFSAVKVAEVKNESIEVIESIEAEDITDALVLAAGNNVVLAPDPDSKAIIIEANDTKYDAAGTSLGLVKTGGDVTINNGVITVNDDSHNHTIANVDGLQTTLDDKAASSDLTSHTDNKSNPHEVTKSQVGLGNVENKSSATIRSEITSANVTTALGYTPLNSNLKGTVNGVAELDANGKIPSSQLPSYVDDVIEGYLYNSKFYKESAHTTVITGETGKIYIDLSSNKTYRWSGSAYAVISETLALGETSSTAYRGDRGKTAYDHSQAAHAPSNAEKNQNAFSNVTVGTTTIAADSVTDTLTLVAGSNITITPDATKDQITIAATDTKYTLPKAGSDFGGVKTGGDVTITDGVITVNDDSHNHTITNVDGLKTELDSKAKSSDLTDHTNNKSNPHGVTATQVGALPTTGGTLTGILYTTASTPLLIGKNGKVGLRASTADLNNVGQINISNAWYGNGNQWGSQISAYNGVTGKYNELRVSHNGIEYNDEAEVAHKVLHDGNISSYAVPTTRKVNNKVLSADISLTASDVGAATTTDITNAINNLDSTVSAETGKYISAITQTNGKITATKASLPTDTNTTYDLAASASSANGNVKLNLTAGGSGSGTDSVSIKGSGATTVTTDANGVITISSTDNDTKYTHPDTHAASMITGLATVATSGKYSDLSGTPNIPTKTSQLTNDSGFKTTDNNTTYTLTKSGSTITLNGSDGSTTSVTDADNNTTYSAAGSSLGLVKSGGDVTISNGVITVNDDSHNHTIANVDGLQTALNGKANDFSIEIYNGTGGNPKPVCFASFNYSTCNSENGIAAKISLVSGHGNGSSYAFLQDAIIRVSYDGSVEVDNFKYYGTETGTYDGANRQYGDIFWLTDSTNKIIDFYCLMGQYSRVNQTPWKRLTYSTGGTVTQHTTCTVYSSGTKVWANNSDIALVSDISTIANNTTYTLTKSGSTITLTGSDGKTSSVTDADTDTKYTHPTSAGNKHIPAGGSSGQILRWSAAGTAAWGADNNTTYSQATSSALGLVKIGFPESGKNYPVELNSSGQMYVNVPWTDNNTVYTHPTHTAKSSGLYKITVDGNGHVSAATAVTKADITALGIPGSDTNTVYTHPSTHPASMITGLAKVATSGNYNDLSNKPTVTTVTIKTWTTADM